MTGRENLAHFYWQASAAGVLLGMVMGFATGAVVAIYFKDPSLLSFVPLWGLLVGAVCGGAAGIAGTVFTSYRGRLPSFWLTAPVAVATAAAVGGLFSGFSRWGWAWAALIAVPAATLLGLLLPSCAERLRRPPGHSSDLA